MYAKSFAKPVSGELTGVDWAGVSVAATGAFFAGSRLAHAVNKPAIRISVAVRNLVLGIILIVNTQKTIAELGSASPLLQFAELSSASLLLRLALGLVWRSLQLPELGSLLATQASHRGYA